MALLARVISARSEPLTTAPVSTETADLSVSSRTRRNRVSLTTGNTGPAHPTSFSGVIAPATPARPRQPRSQPKSPMQSVQRAPGTCRVTRAASTASWSICGGRACTRRSLRPILSSRSATTIRPTHGPTRPRQGPRFVLQWVSVGTLAMAARGPTTPPKVDGKFAHEMSGAGVGQTPPLARATRFGLRRRFLGRFSSSHTPLLLRARFALLTEFIRSEFFRSCIGRAVTASI